MKEFNFYICPRNIKVRVWLKENRAKSISEEEYIVAVKPLCSKSRAPSHLKKEYRNLRDKFGFFKQNGTT